LHAPRGPSTRPPAAGPSVPALSLLDMQEQRDGFCFLKEEDTEYQCPTLAYNIAEVPTPEMCCSLCAQEPQCGAWSWTGSGSFGVSHMCYLKAPVPGVGIRKVRKPGTVSGLPQKSVASAREWIGRGPPAPERPAGERGHRGRVKLFCFALIAPWRFESGLLSLMREHNTSIFACDEHTVYSNTSLDAAAGVEVSLVKSDLRAITGGGFPTPLNLNVFMAAWWQVITDGTFLRCDWTVKVDPDSVFLPSRLRRILPRHSDGPHGVYLNNCRLGLRGSLEVFSRKAVLRWGSGSEECLMRSEGADVCNGPCLWGEDQFIDWCLSKVLHVKRDDAFGLLLDERCTPPQGWTACSDTSRVAYHPFKDEGAYTQCLFSTIA